MTSRDTSTEPAPAADPTTDGTAVSDADAASPAKPDKAARRAARKASRRTAHEAGTGSTTPRRRRRWPLVAAVVVSALFAGAMVALFLVSRPDPIAGVTRTQDAAVSAARQAAINLQTYRRASFDQDFANALASTTPEFRSQQLEPRKDALQQQLVTGGRDTTASVLSAGLVSSTTSQAEVLVVTNTTQTADDGSSTPFLVSRLRITVQLVDGSWLLSDLSNVGLS